MLLKCLSYGDREKFNLAQLYSLLQKFGSEELDNWVAENCWNPLYPHDKSTLEEWQGIRFAQNEKTVQSFVSTCLTALKALSNQQMRMFFSKSDYDFSRFRKEKTAIYFITPPEHQKYYSFVTSLFFRTVFNECMKNENLSRKILPVIFYYDEFGNSYISDFVSTANTIRGYKVSLFLVLQSISQLSMRYGQETANAIQGAINTNICMSGSDPTTINYFSDLSGKVRERQSKPFSENHSDYREFNLLHPNEVRTMGQDEILIISRNRNPAKIKATPYFKNRKFRKMSEFGSVSVGKFDFIIS